MGASADDPPPGRRPSYSVDVAGVGGPRNRPGRSAIAALAVIAALVGGAILSSRLFPPAPAAVEPSALAQASAAASAASPAEAPSEGTPIPVPSGPLTPRITADPVDVVALVAAIPKHGTGPLAFVDGHLHTRPRPCDVGAPLSACMSLYIDGLRGATVVPDDTMPIWPGDPVRGETLVLLPRDGKLVYLGYVLVDAAGIPRIDTLTATVASVPVGSSQLVPSLHEADGVLLNDSTPCSVGVPCDPDAQTLLAIAPGPNPIVDFTGAQAVRIVPGAFGIQPSAIWTTGPFLLRIRTDAGVGVAWDVVAREDQGSILHVVIP
jgi:hypothetical protein